MEDELNDRYNVLHVEGEEARIENLELMLERQVAAISSGVSSAGEVVSLLGIFRNTRLYRRDQDGYMLTVFKEPVPVGRRNIIPVPVPEVFGELAMLGCEEVARQDVWGRWRFSPGMRNDRDLAVRQEFLCGNPEFAGLISRNRDKIMLIWKEVFCHSQFTGCSGGLFAFDGGWLHTYWHMVGKLLVAVGGGFSRGWGGNDRIAISG